MEIICDYFDEGFKVLYNLAEEELKNINSITEKIKGLVYADNKILIAIDDVYSQKAALIFNVIKNIQPLNIEKKDNIRFVLAARIPEFDWVFEKNLWNDADAIQNVEELFDEKYKYFIPYFTLDEVKDFIVKYDEFLSPDRKSKTLGQNADEIFEDTNGYPIMVRYSVLNEGLDAHVKKMYREYLVYNNKINKNRLKTIILNSLFDISNIILTDEILKKFKLFDTAETLRNTIIKKNGNMWKTIHPKWDMQLFRYMFSLKYNLNLIDDSFKVLIKSIISNEQITNFEKLYILNTVYYTFVKENVTNINIIEKMIDIHIIEQKMDNYTRFFLFATIIGSSHYVLKDMRMHCIILTKH